MDLRDALTKSFTGRRSEKITTKALLETAKTAFDAKTWKKVTEESGISERTLRRIRAGGKPSKQTQAKLDSLGKRSEVRQAAVKPGRAKKNEAAKSNGARLKVTAYQGPIGKGRDDYKRVRSAEGVLPDTVMEDLMAAYEAGDDERMQELLEDAVGDYCFDNWRPPGGWTIGSVDDFSLEPL